MKKALSLVLSLVMVLSLCSAFGLAVSAEELVNLAAGKSYTYPTDTVYTNGWSGIGTKTDVCLTDGVKQHVKYYDEQYTGWKTPNADLELVVNLGAVSSVSKVNAYAYGGGLDGISAPTNLAVAVSVDGSNWTTVNGTFTDTTSNVVDDWKNNGVLSNLCVAFDAAVEAQYVKFFLTPEGSFVMLDELEVWGTEAGASAPAKTYKDTYSVSEKVNDDGTTTKEASVEVPYGYTWNITSINGKIAGEDATICTTQAAYDACNPNWAITIYAAKQADGTYKAIKDAIVTPGSAANAGFAVDENNIAIVIHSASSNPDDDALYGNWMSKIVAVSVKAGDVFEVDMDKLTVYAVIPGGSTGGTVVITKGDNVALNKTYTISGCGERTSYFAKLTDGVAKDAISYVNEEWFGFYCNGEDASIINAPDKVGYVVIDLGKETDLYSVRVNTANKAGSGIAAPEYIKAYLSTDGTTFGEAVELPVQDVEDTAYWAEANLSGSARYVKVEVKLASSFAFINEVEVYEAVKTVVNDGPQVIVEEITVDGDLTDTGWNNKGWIKVNNKTGYWQNSYEIGLGEATAPDFGYKYQLRADDTKLYGAIVVDGDAVAGGNGKGTFPRLWIRDNDEATIYTSFFNIEFDADGNVITGAKYNTSTTENKGANIENSTFVAFAKEVDGKSVFEFSVDIAEFCADGTFDYFLSVSQLAGENYGCLYHPASEIGPTDPNGGANHIPHKYLPFNTWHTAKDATINVKDIALGEINVGNVIKEVIAVDGDVNDTGWAKKGWTTVSGENGSWQYPTKKEVAAGTPIPTFTYKFQLRADDAKLYGALVLDGVHEEEKNIKVRIWFRDNDEATVYSSFYDFVFAPDGTLTTAAKYNQSTTENKGAAIEPTTLEAVAKIVDGKTVFEFSVDVTEVTKDGNFDYFVSLERKQGVNTGTLYFPFIPEKDETSPHGNYPSMLWMAENDATVAVEDIVLGEIVVSDKEEADTSMMGTAPADPAFTVTLDTEKGWVAGEKLVVTATVDELKDGVDLSQILFNLFYDAADVEITLPEELGAIITSGKDSWKEDSLFTLSVDGEYGVIECAPATTVEADVLKKGDKLVMTFEFTVKDEAEGLINFQLSNKGLVGYSWDLDAAELAGAGSSLAVANEDALGDTGIYVIAALALVALIGTAIVIKKRA